MHLFPETIERCYERAGFGSSSRKETKQARPPGAAVSLNAIVAVETESLQKQLVVTVPSFSSIHRGIEWHASLCLRLVSNLVPGVTVSMESFESNDIHLTREALVIANLCGQPCMHVHPRCRKRFLDGRCVSAG